MTAMTCPPSQRPQGFIDSSWDFHGAEAGVWGFKGLVLRVSGFVTRFRGSGLGFSLGLRV